MNSKGLRCMNNVRQLANAWRIYADDNRDRIPYASTDGGTDPNNAYAWSGAHMDYSPANRANYDVTYDIMKRPLWPYVGDISIYKCPEDQSSVQTPSGTIVPRVLSMAMNTYLGGFVGTSGGWDSQYPWFPRIFLKTTEFTAITPAKLFVFTDQRPDAINWSNFMVSMSGFSPNNPAQYQIWDFTGFFHDGGAAFSFADGHGELHRWQDARTIPPFNPNGNFPDAVASPSNPDVAWLQDHASRPK